MMKKMAGSETKFNRFRYYLAWIETLSNWGVAFVGAVRDKPPPKKNEYKK
ncbi:MAG: hypothetical protein U9O65_00790 [Thermotogota bacterium]|nr:hypothetical protein [Thermotogota bacterium]